MHLLGTALLAVWAAGSARADAIPPRSAEVMGFENTAGEAMVKMDYQTALQAADAGLAKAPDDFFLIYDKGAAEAGAGRVDEAVSTLQQAEAKAPDAHWKSLVVYRRAIAFQNANRCNEAVAQFNAYAKMVQGNDPDSASMAQRYASSCKTTTTSPRHNVSGHK